MNMFFDVVLFIVSLAINSLLLGLVMTGGTAMAFQLIRNSFPRLRYTLAVAAFLIAAFVPVAITLAGAQEPQSPPITITNTEDGNSGAVSSDNKLVAELRSDSTRPEQTLLSPRTNLLNDLTTYVGGHWLGMLFAGIWAFVSIYLLVREIAGYWRLSNVRKSWRLANAEQRAKFFCPDTVKIYFADEGFFTTGFFSSAIVLPHHLPDNLSQLSIRGIVLHEIAHAKWRDALVNSLLRIVRGLFWTSPALWFLDRVIRAEREAAADHWALVSLSRSSESDKANADYATAIVSIAKLSAAGSSPQHRLLAAMHFGEATSLENRIQRILNAGSQRTWVRLSFGFAIFLLSVLALTIIPVASIPLTNVQAEISPVRFTDNGELNASDFSRQVSRSNLQWADDLSKRDGGEQASDNVVPGITTSNPTENEKTRDQVGAITSTANVVEQDGKVNELTIQPNGSANPNPVIVYRVDSAEPVIRLVHLDIHRNIPRDLRRDININLEIPRVIRRDININIPRPDSAKPVVRPVIRPVVRPVIVY